MTHRWDEDEEAFKKRISQLEWTEEMYSLLQSEKEAKVSLPIGLPT
jgi:hypothetical protein